MKNPLTHKFHAKRTDLDGISFSSKKEAAYYQKLLFLKREKQILFFLRQIPFDLPGGIKHRLDFMIFWTDGHVSAVEVKGYDTPEGKMKRKMVEDLYPIEIEVV